MFTGIIEEIGLISSINRQGEAFELVIKADRIMGDIKVGDSIATNGVCLTVTDLTKQSFSADVMLETLRRSNLRDLKPNSKVNLERALRLNDRLGGHLVAGHVDGVGELLSRHQEGIAELFQFKIIEQGENINKYLVEKGSIALDGISLTIFNCQANKFSVSVVPHSKHNTTIGTKSVGDRVNIEVDMIGKYVEKLYLQTQGIEKKKGDSSEMISGAGEALKSGEEQLNINKLREWGY